jgi:hypothetical protein
MRLQDTLCPRAPSLASQFTLKDTKVSKEHVVNGEHGECLGVGAKALFNSLQ